MTRRTQILTGSCAVEFRCRRISATKRGGRTCVARSAATTATATKDTSRRNVRLGIAVREQHGNGHDRSELADRPDGQHGRSQRHTQDPAVAQDRQQRAQGSGRETQRDDDRVEDETRPVKQRTERRAQRRLTPPTSPGRAPDVPLPHDGEVQLGAGEEHQEGQPEVGQRRHDAVGVSHIEHKGPEGDPEEDLDHDFGDRKISPGPLGDDRREDRGNADQDERRDGGSRSCVVSSPYGRPLWHALPPPEPHATRRDPDGGVSAGPLRRAPG